MTPQNTIICTRAGKDIRLCRECKKRYEAIAYKNYLASEKGRRHFARASARCIAMSLGAEDFALALGALRVLRGNDVVNGWQEAARAGRTPR